MILPHMGFSGYNEQSVLDLSIRAYAYLEREFDYRRDFEEHAFMVPRTVDDLLPAMLTNSTFTRDTPLKAVRGLILGASVGGLVGLLSADPSLWTQAAVFGALIDTATYTVRGHYAVPLSSNIDPAPRSLPEE